jgi:hypothetical protein
VGLLQGQQGTGNGTAATQFEVGIALITLCGMSCSGRLSSAFMRELICVQSPKAPSHPLKPVELLLHPEANMRQIKAHPQKLKYFDFDLLHIQTRCSMERGAYYGPWTGHTRLPS